MSTAGPSVKFAVEPLAEVWDEMVLLAANHWAETQNYRHTQPFNPKKERYEAYDKIGAFIQFTARDQGKLVGYGGIYIVPSMHTQETIAQEDTWYLAPDYRKGLTAVRFFKFMESECVRRGVVDISLTTPYGLKSGRICEFMKYKPVATVWNKQFRASKGPIY